MGGQGKGSRSSCFIPEARLVSSRGLYGVLRGSRLEDLPCSAEKSKSIRGCDSESQDHWRLSEFTLASACAPCRQPGALRRKPCALCWCAGFSNG